MNNQFYSLRTFCSIFCFMLCVASNSQGFKVNSFKQSLKKGRIMRITVFFVLFAFSCNALLKILR